MDIVGLPVWPTRIQSLARRSGMSIRLDATGLAGGAEIGHNSNLRENFIFLRRATAMFVVTVIFQIHSHSVEAFREAVIQQARNSKENEPACHQFDVSQSSEDPARFFLYETYTDAAAFETHRQTPYFAEFSQTVQPMVASKQSHLYQRIEPAGV